MTVPLLFPRYSVTADKSCNYSGSPAATDLGGKYARESGEINRRSEVIAITSDWLHRCNTSHHRCGRKQPRPFPTRLLYIGEKSPGLDANVWVVESQPNQTGLYAALSYNWGTSSDKMLKLKKATHAEFQKKIIFSKLIRSHQEGIKVARELQYEYIWIDGLCIIQDDNDDWATQSVNICQIYGNADLTIVAGRGKDAESGFLEPKYKPMVQEPQLPYRSPGKQDSEFGISLPRNYDIGPTDERAWCYQESLMGRRMIIYGEQQLSFRCRERVEYEDGCCQLIQEADGWYNLSFLTQYPSPKDPGLKLYNSPKFYISLGFRDPKTQRLDPGQFAYVQQQGYTRASRAEGLNRPILYRWYAMVSEYSERDFFDPTDNHAAISGIVLQIQQALAAEAHIPRTGINRFRLKEKIPSIPGERYMAGLWERDMVYGLLWRSRRLVDPRLSALTVPMRAEQLGQEKKEVRRAPSWSWMSLVGPICQGYLTLPLSDGAMFRCAPVRGSWSAEPDAWGPLVVKRKEFPQFPLEIRAYIREVRVSKYDTKDFGRASAWGTIAGVTTMYPIESMHRHTVLLEAKENKPLVKRSKSTLSPADAAQIVATGCFDMQYSSGSTPQHIWAMRVTSKEGLLLGVSNDPQYKTQVFRRLGVFVIENDAVFYPRDAIKKSSSGFLSGPSSDVVEDRVPMSNVMIV